MINPIIFGSSGMIGQAVLIECLDDPEVKSVLVVNRRPVDQRHPKLKEIIQENISDLSGKTNELSGFDTCFFCLGVSAAGMSEEAYTRITYDLTISVAETLLKSNNGMTFCYITGAGTDSSEKGRMMWARVKGRTENALLKMPFKSSYMFRPGYIQPLKGLRSRTRLYNIFYTVFKPLYFILKPFKSLVTNTTSMARAMIHVAKHGYPKKIITSRDINSIAKEK